MNAETITPCPNCITPGNCAGPSCPRFGERGALEVAAGLRAELKAAETLLDEAIGPAPVGTNFLGKVDAATHQTRFLRKSLERYIKRMAEAKDAIRERDAEIERLRGDANRRRSIYALGDLMDARRMAGEQWARALEAETMVAFQDRTLRQNGRQGDEMLDMLVTERDRVATMAGALREIRDDSSLPGSVERKCRAALKAAGQEG